MSEKNETKQAAIAVQQMDTTLEGIKGYIESAEQTWPEQSNQWRHKAAVGRFWLDLFGVTDAETRANAMKQFMATPSAFGCNDSQLAQKLGERKKRVAPTADFLAA